MRISDADFICGFHLRIRRANDSLLIHPLQDIFIIATSSCTRCLPSRRGYGRVSSGVNGAGTGRGRGRDSDAENRLIDELNEEWDD